MNMISMVLTKKDFKVMTRTQTEIHLKGSDDTYGHACVINKEKNSICSRRGKKKQTKKLVGEGEKIVRGEVIF